MSSWSSQGGGFITDNVIGWVGLCICLVVSRCATGGTILEFDHQDEISTVLIMTGLGLQLALEPWHWLGFGPGPVGVMSSHAVVNLAGVINPASCVAECLFVVDTSRPG